MKQKNQEPIAGHQEKIAEGGFENLGSPISNRATGSLSSAIFGLSPGSCQDAR